ncbi:putative AMP-dependent synthetase/ligase [Lupinus albus]|uniref:Putative AMP-dependent synthetase/ligase n=1 Tax=Lupinus albus TaxID=3870 RepID=A0A6A4Q539_LUPAL|nr:putative AMP-dependent synthetase/ligase [Lupinus albus]
MANQPQTHPNVTIDPNSGFNSQTRTFHSLRPNAPLPPPTHPLSLTDYTLSLIPSTAATAIIDSDTDTHLSYSVLLRQIKSLASSLKSLIPSLSKGHVALILSPSSLHVPVLYFSLLSLGVVIAPANPLSTPSELTHIVQLTKPVIAFTTSSTSTDIPNLQLGTVIIDSPQFISMLNNFNNSESPQVEVAQSDLAAILFSSGTTGRVKGVELTHRNFIALTGGFCHTNLMTGNPEEEIESKSVSLFTLPLFHVFGFFMMVYTIALGETLVLMQRFDFERMLKLVEKYRISSIPVSPPLVVLLAKSELVNKYDVSSLKILGCGGAPLGKVVLESFAARFPNTIIEQVRKNFIF